MKADGNTRTRRPWGQLFSHKQRWNLQRLSPRTGVEEHHERIEIGPICMLFISSCLEILIRHSKKAYPLTGCGLGGLRRWLCSHFTPTDHNRVRRWERPILYFKWKGCRLVERVMCNCGNHYRRIQYRGFTICIMYYITPCVRQV